jgi:hypothetical protein
MSLNDLRLHSQNTVPIKMDSTGPISGYYLKKCASTPSNLLGEIPCCDSECESPSVHAAEFVVVDIGIDSSLCIGVVLKFSADDHRIPFTLPTTADRKVNPREMRADANRMMVVPTNIHSENDPIILNISPCHCVPVRYDKLCGWAGGSSSLLRGTGAPEHYENR